MIYATCIYVCIRGRMSFKAGQRFVDNETKVAAATATAAVKVVVAELQDVELN